MSDIFNQHNVHGPNIINIGRPEFKLTDDILAQIHDAVKGCSSFSLVSVADWQMGDRLAQFLISKGLSPSNFKKTATYASVPPHEKPIQISIGGQLAHIILDPS